MLGYENIESKSDLFTLWLQFYDHKGVGNTIKCGKKLFEDILRYFNHFQYMFEYKLSSPYSVKLIKGLKKDSFIIVIGTNVANSR